MTASGRFRPLFKNQMKNNCTERLSDCLKMQYMESELDSHWVNEFMWNKVVFSEWFRIQPKQV